MTVNVTVQNHADSKYSILIQGPNCYEMVIPGAEYTTYTYDNNEITIVEVGSVYDK